MSDQTSTIEIHAEEQHKDSGVLSPDASMLLLTWITFFALLAVLYKFAWKPILSALDEREKHIRESVENADKIKEEIEKLNITSEEILAKANAKSKLVIEDSRKAAKEAARVIEDKTKEEAQIILENARREIKSDVEKAKSDLRAMSADIAVKLAGKILEENLDNEKNKKLINTFIKEL